MTKKQQLTDLPVKYVKICKTRWWMDSTTGARIHDDNIHKYTASFKANKEQEIINKRWDLKRD